MEKTAITQYLIAFEKKALEAQVFKKVLIKDKDDTCCIYSCLNVIDFDEYKDKINDAKKDVNLMFKNPYKDLGSYFNRKSVDFLNFNLQEDCFDFIEMKDIEKTINDILNENSILDLEKQIDILSNKIANKFCFELKLADSIWILNDLSNYFYPDMKTRLLFETISKNFYILTNLKSISFDSIIDKNLTSTEIMNEIENQINFNNMSDPYNVINDFEAYYYMKAEFDKQMKLLKSKFGDLLPQNTHFQIFNCEDIEKKFNNSTIDNCSLKNASS